MKVAIYARVSRSDASQNPDNQLDPLRQWVKTMQAESAGEYVDRASGSRSDREQFLLLLKDAEQHRFDVVVVWSLDRFSREGISNTLAYLKRLKRNQVGVKSLQEGWLDTRDEGVGELLLAVFSWVAQQERKRIAERVKAGHDRARKEGKKIGRPKGAKDKVKRSVSGYHLRYANTTKAQRRLK